MACLCRRNSRSKFLRALGGEKKSHGARHNWASGDGKRIELWSKNLKGVKESFALFWKGGAREGFREHPGIYDCGGKEEEGVMLKKGNTGWGSRANRDERDIRR